MVFIREKHNKLSLGFINYKFGSLKSSKMTKKPNNNNQFDMSEVEQNSECYDGDLSQLNFQSLHLYERKLSNESSQIRQESMFFSQKNQKKCRIAPNNQISCKKHKNIDKPIHQNSDKRRNLIHKKRISLLQNKIEELKKEILALERNQYQCYQCKHRQRNNYRQRIQEILQPEHAAGGAIDDKLHHYNQSFQFQKIDFNSPLMQTEQMEQKMWIFVGTMLIAMGSKIMDFDGTINTFKILKQSVDNLRRQVQKCQPKIGLQFFCTKQEIQESAVADELCFDPFYSNKQNYAYGNFMLEGIKLQSVEQNQLFYQNKFQFSIKYDTLLTIMEFAKNNSSIM